MARPKASVAADVNSTASKAKVVKVKKAVAGLKKPKVSTTISHPKYGEMISNALVSLKERNGSSVFAIIKFIEKNQTGLPSNFKKFLSVQLKRQVASGKLVKVKNSYKLSSELSKAAKTAILVKKKADAKQLKVSEKSNPKVGIKRKVESSDKPVKPSKAPKTSVKATAGKKVVVGRGKKSAVAIKKPAIAKAKKVAVKKPVVAKMKKPIKKATPAKGKKSSAVKATKGK